MQWLTIKTNLPTRCSPGLIFDLHHKSVLPNLGDGDQIVHDLWGVCYFSKCDIMLHPTPHGIHLKHSRSLRPSCLIVVNIYSSLALHEISKIKFIVGHVLRAARVQHLIVRLPPTCRHCHRFLGDISHSCINLTAFNRSCHLLGGSSLQCAQLLHACTSD